MTLLVFGGGEVMRFIKICVLVSLVLGVTALHAQTPGTLTVRVRNASTEESVAQAEVGLATFGGGAEGHRGFTDKTGNLTLAGVAAGNYYLEVRAPGYIPSRESIDVPDGAMQSFDVALRPEQKRGELSPSPSAASAADLAVPKEARKHLDEGMKRAKENPEDAAKHFQKALEIYPKFARAEAMLGVTQFQRKLLDEAEGSAKKAIAVEPGLGGAHTLLGKVYVQKQDYSAAELELLQGARLDPTSWEPPYQLARCYSGMKQYDKAMQYALQAHQSAGAPTTTHLLMVDVYLAKQDPGNALRELEEFAKADPQSPYMPAVRKKMEMLKKEQR
jgi:tetratricopeptide (TPR) repeat protein